MTIVLKIKRSINLEPVLQYGELAYTNITGNSDLYIGDSTNTATIIGGSSFAQLNSPIFTGTVSTPALSVTNSTASSGTGSGALIVTGGVGVAGAVYTGGIVNVGVIAVSVNFFVRQNIAQRLR